MKKPCSSRASTESGDGPPKPIYTDIVTLERYLVKVTLFDSGGQGMTNLYILQGKTAVPEPDVVKWLEWWRTANKLVMKTRVDTNELVITFFLAYNLGRDAAFRPLVFETRVMGGHQDGVRSWYSTWEEAEAGHVRMVDLVMGDVSP
jgi:hypothetical protein